jgi:Spy/CpxP family protein refolding chaperone
MEEKMSKKTQLLVLAFAVFVAVSCLPCVAQGTTPQAPPAASSAGQAASDQDSVIADPETRAKVQEGLQHLSSELNLSDEQKKEIKPILQDEYKQLKSVSDDTSLSSDQKRAKAKDLHATYHSRISAILTPEQQQKLAAMKEEWKDQ